MFLETYDGLLSFLKILLNPIKTVDWEDVYAEQLPRVYNYFRYRVGDEALAEDLTQTTFEKAWRARDRYRKDRGAFTTWLFTIARRTAADYYRSRPDDEQLEKVRLIEDGRPVEQAYEDRNDVDQLVLLLAKLADRERELVALKYGAGLTNRDIAKQTGLSETNVGTILYRVVNRLREEWESNK
jgi:RNA polymerase sigma-70 factor, ECF subfamily